MVTCCYNKAIINISRSIRRTLTTCVNVITINYQFMSLNKMLSISAALTVVLMGSCTKEDDTRTQISPNGKSNAREISVLESVNLGTAGDFAILTKTGITNVYKSAVTGNVGASPITGAALLLSCAEVAGTIYTVDAAGPLPCRVTSASMLTTAIGDMQTAYTDAAGRSNPDFLNLGAGNIGGATLTPGLYKWTTALIIPADVTITGGPNDIWIFQVAGTMKMSNAVRITLAGGAQAKNIIWQVAGAVTLGTTSHFEGSILGQTAINMQTGASINGRLLAQTAATLQMNTIVKP